MADTDESEDHVYEGQNGTDEPAPVWENEPESLMRNEPGDPPPANDDTAAPGGLGRRRTGRIGPIDEITLEYLKL